jgi:hypothetical protein
MNSVHKSKETHITITKISWLILFKEITFTLRIFHKHKMQLLIDKGGGTYSYHWTFKS